MNEPIRVTIRRPDDGHMHARSGSVMQAVVPETARHFARALVMPNDPAIEYGLHAISYRDAILRAAVEAGCTSFEPLMTIKLTHRTSPRMIEEAHGWGVIAAKLYPAGATHASADGIHVPLSPLMHEVYRAMADCGMVLCVHGEEPSAFVLEREESYHDVISNIIDDHPTLKVVLEHITTAASVDFVRGGPPTLAASVTAHHLIHTLDDVLGAGLKPHHFCYPVPKHPTDRAALCEAVMEGDDDDDENWIFFGSDSAPHLRGAKESACGCAGVFSATVAMAVLARVFLGRGGDTPDPARVTALEAFTSGRFAAFYGLPPNEGTITLERSPWIVPRMIGNVVPLHAGDVLDWSVVGDG